MLEEIIGYEALWESMMKCKSGVMWKSSVANFVLRGVCEVAKLCDELHDGTYREKPRKTFIVTSPKRREIVSVHFRDRVYQRSLNDVAVYPEMVRHFIYDNAACQKGKGTEFARGRLKCHMQRFYRKHGTNGFILKMDVRGYYPNMRHDVVKKMFARYLPPEIFKLVEQVIDRYPGDVGFNPGSQMIQIAGISTLNSIDHFIKERLLVKHYLRYMDDMIVIGETREELQSVKEAVAERLALIGFELHRDKTRIMPLTHGVMFLSFRFRLTATGKVVLTIDPDRVKAERRKLRRMARKMRNGEMTREKIVQCYGSWRNHASHGTGMALLYRMDAYLLNLLNQMKN